MGTRTPWGTSDYSHRYARGVIFYGTPGHGGIHLSPTMNARVHPALRLDDGWYEEDCDWARVALSFPELFPGKLEAAKSTLRNYQPDAYTAATGEPVTIEQSHVLAERALRAKHANDYVTVTAYGDWHARVPAGMVGVCAVRGGRTERGNYASADQACFLVPADEYNAPAGPGWLFGFVIDESRHQRVSESF